jgi:hypothetical protein
MAYTSEIFPVIAALTHNEQAGLNVFLPSPSSQSPPLSSSDPIILPLNLPTEAPTLPQNLRAFAARLFMRYAYVLGDSPTVFMGMKSPTQTERMLTFTDGKRDVALLCINDDVESNARRTEEVLKKWFRTRWPEKLLCEV